MEIVKDVKKHRPKKRILKVVADTPERTIDDYHVNVDSEAHRDRWQEVVSKPNGEVVYYGSRAGLKVLVMRATGSLCAYVGIPTGHPIAGFFYDDIPLDCHGGLTFCGDGTADNSWPEGFYWYGWDYGHAGDYFTFLDTLPTSLNLEKLKEYKDHKWIISEVIQEASSVAYDMSKLVELAEKCANKGRAEG